MIRRSIIAFQSTRVPEYQRSYSWTRTYWENLFEDIVTNDDAYFIGTIITVEDDTKPCIDVLDGQQRLITVSLLLLALYDSLRAKINIENADHQEIILDLRRRLVQVRDGRKEQRLHMLDLDNEQYRKLLLCSGLIEDTIPQIDGRYKNLVLKAYDYFVSEVQDRDLDELFKLTTKVQNLTTVKIRTEDMSETYSLFEALNGKSFPLSIIDLLKIGYFKIEKDPIVAQERWDQIIEKLETDNVATGIRFFLNNYRAFAIDYGLSQQTITRTNAVKKYQDLIEDQEAGFITELIDNAELFAQVIRKDKVIGRIRKLDVSQVYPLLMYLLKHKERLGISDEQFSVLIDHVGAFFVKRNVSNVPQARDVAAMTLSLLKDLKGKTGEQAIKLVRERLKRETISDAELKEKLSEVRLYDNPNVAMYVLSRLEDVKRPLENRGVRRDFDSRTNNGAAIWQVEHILPQTQELRPEWISMLLGGNAEDDDSSESQLERARIVQSENVGKLGNLTITAHNSNLSDKPFAEKKDFIKGREELWLNEGVLEKETWTAREIDERTNALIEAIVALIAADQL